MFTRRAFVKGSSLAMFGIGVAPSWLARAASTSTGRKKVLVTIFQRGAADGLNVVVPFGESRYYDLRPTLAVPKPGSDAANSAVDLDGFFGLHPSLAPLKPIYDAKALAIVHATGSPDPTRSHFDAQDYMEAGTPGMKSTRDGWLNRALLPPAAKSSPLRALALGQSLPRMLRGKNPAVAVNNIADFQVRDSASSEMFESMYSRSLDTVLQGTGKDTFEAVKMLKAIQKENYSPAGGAAYPSGRFGQSMRQIAQLIKANVGVEVAFADIGGWDTHTNQPANLSARLSELGQAMAAFYKDLGDSMADVVAVTMSEFGRTAKENGTRGTDHGHANAMFVMGGAINGGAIHGEWPGLQQEQLYESRDLAVTTDFRDVLSELVANHLGNRQISAVFPGYQADAKKYRGVVTA